MSNHPTNSQGTKSLMFTTKKLILASSSTYRQSIIQTIGLECSAIDPNYEEEHDLDLPVEQLVVELAVRKARSLSKDYPDALIIGSDQVAELDGEILFKPGTPDRSKAQLAKLSNRTHRLLTGMAVFEPSTSRLETTLDIHQMTMRKLSEQQIADYVALENPIDCCGSYKIEGPGMALFKSMTGDDHTGIIGLPVTKLTDLLQLFDPKFPRLGVRP